MSQTYTEEQQRMYIEFILGRLWSAAKGLLRDRAVDQIAREIPDVVRPISKVTANLDKAPSLSMVGGDVYLRAPASGTHRLDLWLNLDITAHVEFAFTLKLKPNGTPDIEHSLSVDIDLPWYWDLILAGLGTVSFGVGAIVASKIPEILELIIKAVIEGQLGGENSQLESSLSMLSSLTYNHQAAFEPNNVVLTPINTGAPDIGTNVSSAPLDWIDIVLVADGYEEANKAGFELQTDNIARVLLTIANRLDNERLREMRSVIRMWRLPIWGTQATERITDTTTSGGSTISSLRNLARLAEAGLRAEAALEADRGGPLTLRPIVVALRRDSGSTRAISLGDVVLLPVKPSDNGADAGSVLIHELGHTVGRLADEYTRGSTKTYMGPEPSAINVSTMPLNYAALALGAGAGAGVALGAALCAAHKWIPWINKTPHASPSDPNYKVDSIYQGAYEFGSGIYRPANRCKMRHSKTDEPFCPVCEETLALGLLGRIGMYNAQARAALTLQITYTWPWRTEPKLYTVQAPLIGGSQATIELPAFREVRGRVTNTTSFQVRVVRAVIPDYQVEMQQLPDPPQGGETMTVERDAIVQLTVRPASDSPLPATVRTALAQRVTLNFNQDVEFDLEEPTDLAQDPAVGSRINREVDPTTGCVSLDLSLEAKSGAGVNLDQQTETVFVLEPASGEKIEIWRWDLEGVVLAHTVTPHDYLADGLPPGRYTWGAMARIVEGVQSNLVQLNRPGDFHFEVGDVQVAPYTALPKPLLIRINVLVHDAPDIVALPLETVVPDVPEAEMRPGLIERIRELIEAGPDILEPDPQPGPDPTPERTPDVIRPEDDREPPRPRPAIPTGPGVPISISARTILSHQPISNRAAAKLRAFELPNNRVRVFAERPKAPGRELMPPLPIPPSYGGGGAALAFASTVQPILKRTCVAFAYHPEGKPMYFDFEFKNKDQDFTGDDLILSGMISPANPHRSFLVHAQVSLLDERLPNDLNQLFFKVRVRTHDEDGKESPWLEELNPPLTYVT